MNGNLPSGTYTAAYHMFSQSKILNFPHGLREKLRGMRMGADHQPWMRPWRGQKSCLDHQGWRLRRTGVMNERSFRWISDWYKDWQVRTH